MMFRSRIANRQEAPNPRDKGNPVKRSGLVVFGLLLGACQGAPEEPEWLTRFHYAGESLHDLEIRDFGYPFVPVVLGQETLRLPFDTGNMVGLTLEAGRFKSLGLPCSERRNRRDSGGRLISSSCVANGIDATVLGVRFDSISVFEFEHESLPGLVGPGTIPGSRFTLDYRAGILAIDNLSSPDTVPGFVALPLVRAPRLPLLVLVTGRVQGHEVIVEIDTGKSRTTIDRGLVSLLALQETASGVSIGTVELGPKSWTVDAARVVDTSGISEGLAMPISLGIGSDLLADFVFTVDYTAARLWIEDPR